MGLVPSEGETEKCLSPSLFLCPSPPLFLLSSLSLPPSLPPSLSPSLSLSLSFSLSLCSAPGEEAVLMPGRLWSAGSFLWNFQPPERGGCDCCVSPPSVCGLSLVPSPGRTSALPSPCVTATLRSWLAASSPASQAPSCPASQAPCPAGESGQVKNTPPSCGGQSGHTRGSPGLTLVFIPASLLALQESR